MHCGSQSCISVPDFGKTFDPNAVSKMDVCLSYKLLKINICIFSILFSKCRPNCQSGHNIFNPKAGRKRAKYNQFKCRLEEERNAINQKLCRAEIPKMTSGNCGFHLDPDLKLQSSCNLYIYFCSVGWFYHARARYLLLTWCRRQVTLEELTGAGELLWWKNLWN